MAKQIQIKISNPCHQKWSEMTPTKQGAFCQSCQTNVTDFTGKTENEIYEIVANTKGGGCGMFYKDQIAAPIRKTEIDNSFFNWKAIAASLAALIAADNLSASENKPGIVYSTSQVLEDTITAPVILTKELDEDTITVTISGVVINTDSKQPVNGADIYIDSTEYRTESDKQGNFILTIPKYLLKDKTLFVTDRLFNSKYFQLRDINTNKKLKVLLSDMRILGRWG